MKKGTRVEIQAGPGEGKTGEVFWKGKNKWGDGLRLGIRGDDGETYWAADSEVQKSSKPAPKVDAGPTFEKGDRVRFQNNGQEGFGTVFWIGKSRRGPGQRLGIRDDHGPDDDAVWLDARFAEPLSAEDEPGPREPEPHASPAPRDDHADAAPPAEVWAPQLSSEDLPPAAPVDDGWADQEAAAQDAAGEPGIPADW